MGTETWADVKNVLFMDCQIHDSSHALAVYARDGGRVDGVTFRNIRGNGHTVTYDPTLETNRALGSRTYALTDGGVLRPR